MNTEDKNKQMAYTQEDSLSWSQRGAWTMKRHNNARQPHIERHDKTFADRRDVAQHRLVSLDGRRDGAQLEIHLRQRTKGRVSKLRTFTEIESLERACICAKRAFDVVE